MLPSLLEAQEKNNYKIGAFLNDTSITSDPISKSNLIANLD